VRLRGQLLCPQKTDESAAEKAANDASLNPGASDKPDNSTDET
jgi:hypothetical protein